jgi:F-type H+-transporting ATPase subunit gamma
MARAAEITAQITSLKELTDIIGAIRAMAAAQMRQSLRTLDAVRDYTEIIRQALAEAEALIPDDGEDGVGRPARSDPGLVVFYAEHGFCGAFNEPLIRAASEAARRESNLHLIFVGTRGAQRAAEHGLEADMTLAMASHSGGVAAVVRRLAAELYRMFIAQTISSLDVLYTREASGQQGKLQSLRLLPLETTPPADTRGAIPPLVNMNARELRDVLASEYMFAILEAAAVESFASENASRFRTMEAAHENVARKSSELQRLAHRMRQETVTAEILEIISGAEAMNSG